MKKKKKNLGGKYNCNEISILFLAETTQRKNIFVLFCRSILSHEFNIWTIRVSGNFTESATTFIATKIIFLCLGDEFIDPYTHTQ